MLWNTARVASEKSLNAAPSLPIFGHDVVMNNHPFTVAKALAGFDVAPPAAPSQPHDLIVRVTKGDGIVDWNVTLEGTTFHQDRFNAKTDADGDLYWELTLNQFPVTGTLNAILYGRGANSYHLSAHIVCDGKELEPLFAKTVEGVALDRKDYHV